MKNIRLNLPHDVLFLWGKEGSENFDPSLFDGELLSTRDSVVFAVQTDEDGPVFLCPDQLPKEKATTLIWQGELTGPLKLEDSAGDLIWDWPAESTVNIVIVSTDELENDRYVQHIYINVT